MLHVASDGIVRVYRRGLLRRITPPSIEVTPDRWVHAYEQGSDLTVCGRKVLKLHWEPFVALDFASMNDSLYCPRCATSAAST